MGCFSLSYCPLISLKHASSCYHRTCRIAWHLMEFKVLLVYKRHCLLSPVQPRLSPTLLSRILTCRVSPVFPRTQWGIQWDKGIPPLCLPILRDKCQVMLFLVALCATVATYGIRNATAIGTIAITHAFVTTRCPPVRCTNFSPLIMVLVSNALLGSFMWYCCNFWH